MSPNKRFFIVAGVAIMAVGAAFHGWGSPSECFYTAVPTIALAYFLTGVVDWRGAFQRQIGPGIAVALGLFTLSVGVAFLFLGARVALSWRFWREAATCLYFLGSIAIVLMTIRRAILSGARAVTGRYQFSPSVRIVLCQVLPLALFVLVALPLGMAFVQVHRFKMPNFATPKTIWHREFEEIEFPSADGTLIRGWWIPARKPSPRTLVICHGIAANRSMFLPFVEVGDWLGANVLMFDLRGHGDSGGRTITFGYREKDDILAALAWARRERLKQARHVIGLGISYGAASLAEAAARAEPPFDAVILDTCFTSTRDMTQSVIGVFPKATPPWLLTLGLPLADWHAGCAMTEVCPEKSIEQLRSPVLFLHSRGDPLIPSEHATRLYERAPGPKRLCVFELSGHCDAFFAENDRYKDEVIQFAFSARRAPCER